MLPSIAMVSSVEMIRDGGSLAAIFHGGNGAEYWLFFKVRIVEDLPSGEHERVGYEEPVIVERQVGLATEISWQYAKVLLNQIRPWLREETHLKWLEAMYKTAESSGELPPGVERKRSFWQKLGGEKIT